MKNMFGISSCCLWLACQALAVAVSGDAQEISNPPLVEGSQSELAFFLGQQDAIKADGLRLQTQIDELKKEYAADPNAGLKEQIRERETFANELQTAQSKAEKLVDPVLLPTLDLLVHDLQGSANSLKTDLKTRQRVTNPDRIALKSQIDKVQKEIDMNTKLAKAVTDKIKSIQDDRRREGVGSELDALANMPASGGKSGVSPESARPGVVKEH